MGYETIFINPADVLSQLPLISSCSISSEQEPRWQSPARSSERMLCSAPSPSPQHPLALLPQPHGTEDSHAQECEGAARPQQCLCSQFLTFSLLQAQHLKLCLCCCIPEAPGAFTSTKHQRDKKCSAATSEQNKSIFLPVLALTAPSKREGNF